MHIDWCTSQGAHHPSSSGLALDTVRGRVIFNVLTLMYKVKNGIAPVYLSVLVEHYKPGRMLCSSSLYYDKFVEIPTFLVTGGDRAFSKAGPVLWNKLPLHIQSAK